MAEAEVRTRAVRPHELLVRQDGSLDSGPSRDAAVRRDRLDLDDPCAFFVEEAWMRDISDPRDPIPTAEILVEARGADLARLAFGLRPAGDECVAHAGLHPPGEPEVEHDEGQGRPQ